METGTVKFFNVEKGSGFITPDGGGPDLYVHVSSFRGSDLTVLEEGQRVEYEVMLGPKGAKDLRAIGVRVL
ncbi:cold-shock protein [Pseudomonas veronii]|uniref:cold-shock protein n=1 Tax=Pseudomonas veronii TaxID=76761 RepID=UPI0009A50E65|nr:cold shock domain-containing protein [Pseudomonas veronii]AQY67693.1 cold-shock protein [Pseudomonas veronii]